MTEHSVQLLYITDICIDLFDRIVYITTHEYD